MGNLHVGHLSLVQRARESAEEVVVSIFVNPTQFGPDEDLAQYPRTLDSDLAKLKSLDVELVFVPNVADMYPNGTAQRTQVAVTNLSTKLCGRSRPDHFAGVTTVVSKLFHLIQPDFAIFGEKDWQQLRIIQTMVEDLNYPLRIISAPIVRESDGLAMSSRNKYLSKTEREIAPQLNRVLRSVSKKLRIHRADPSSLENLACSQLVNYGFEPDYVCIRNEHDLEPPRADTPLNDMRIFAAAYLGKPRLIDNVPVVDA